jgi:hypothetical protein
MANTYGIGNGVRVSVKFRAVQTGAYVDPTTVTVLVKDPSLNVVPWVYGVDAEVQKTATGLYFFVVDADEAGVWEYRWEGTGVNQAASEGSFTVTPSVF